jgi:hypothetical protein
MDETTKIREGRLEKGGRKDMEGRNGRIMKEKEGGGGGKRHGGGESRKGDVPIRERRH